MELEELVLSIEEIDRDWRNFLRSKIPTVNRICNKPWEIRLSKSSDIAKKFIETSKDRYPHIKIKFLDEGSRYLSDIKLLASKSDLNKEDFLIIARFLANPKYESSDIRMFKLAN